MDLCNKSNSYNKLIFLYVTGKQHALAIGLWTQHKWLRVMTSLGKNKESYSSAPRTWSISGSYVVDVSWPAMKNMKYTESNRLQRSYIHIYNYSRTKPCRTGALWTRIEPDVSKLLRIAYANSNKLTGWTQ